tara:strand:+ start:374 stop:538 length:165 start_codon:yes stop_codon:yes gene_type:complete
MGGDVTAESDGLIGIFSSVQEIEDHLDKNGYLGDFTEKSKLQQKQTEYILQNWK